MTGLRYTLLGDGPTDRVLMPLIKWALQQRGVHVDQSSFADLRDDPTHPKTLRRRITAALNRHPCDLLLVHRDAEKERPALRYTEVAEAMSELPHVAHVAIVPVRMSEAWLLHDESAIRYAANHPHGKHPLGLPPSNKWDKLPNPKKVLDDALLAANASQGRALRTFRKKLRQNRYRVADLIDDFSKLATVPAFQRFVSDLDSALAQLGLPRDTRDQPGM